MARAAHISASAPSLTLNNKVYLYRLLSRELGCGKQTFLPAVEEALASDRMTADDLGFESTRALLEALDEFIKLTVFKGGRIYATVIEQAAWEESLASEPGKSTQPAKANKPWKRKKADKTLKPVRPKRVKRSAPDADRRPDSETDGGIGKDDARPLDQDGRRDLDGDGNPGASDAVPIDDEAEKRATDGDARPDNERRDVDEEGGGRHDETAQTPADGDAMETAEGREEVPIAKPAYSLTVTYDPYSGIDTETKLESNPVPPTKVTVEPQAPAANETVAPGAPPVADGAETTRTDRPARAADHAPVSRPAPAPVPDPVPLEAAPKRPLPSPEVLATYPKDLNEEVYLPSEAIADLCELLPYGTDVFSLLAEDYSRARSLEILEGARARIVFPLRIQHAGDTDPIRVILKRRSGSGLGWELERAE